MANFAATLDLHPEIHHTKYVADNQFTPAVTAAATGILYCSKHPGLWISRPKTHMLFMKKTEVRDCPACLKEMSSSSDLSSSNKPTVQSDVDSNSVNSKLKAHNTSVFHHKFNYKYYLTSYKALNIIHIHIYIYEYINSYTHYY